jgi:hypothetical protein
LVVAPVVCALALPAGASAAGSSGLHIDPASPVVKAYALPLDGVRAMAAIEGRRAKLFGSGIEPAKRRQPAMARRTRDSVAPAAYRMLEAGSSSGLAWMAIAAVVVLVCGGAGALALRHRQ